MNLTTIKNLKRQIEVKMLELEEFESLYIKACTFSDKVKTSSTGDNTAKLALELNKIKLEIQNQIAKLLELKREGKRRIDLIAEEKERSILSLYYIADLSIKEVAYQLHYAYPTVHRILRNKVNV